MDLHLCGWIKSKYYDFLCLIIFTHIKVPDHHVNNWWCIISPPTIVSGGSRDLWHILGAKSRKELCCHVVKERSRLSCSSRRSTLDRAPVACIPQRFLCVYTGENFLPSTLVLPYDHNIKPWPCEGIRARKARKSSYPSTPQRKYDKTSWILVVVNTWNILLQSGLKCKMNLVILFFALSSEPTWKKHTWVTANDSYSQRRQIENKLTLYSVFGSSPWNSLVICKTTFMLWTCTVQPMSRFYFLMTNCSELKANQVSESQKSYSSVNSEGSKPRKIFNTTLLYWKFLTYI